MLTRRSMMQLGASAWLLAGLPRVRAQTHRSAPRYFVNVYCRGGIDAIYTMDPKTRADVEPNVDIPYDANAIVDAGTIQFGPHFAPLRKWAPKLAVVRGVQTQVANHETGSYQILRMRTGVSGRTPGFCDVLGQHRDGQALSTVSLGKLASFEHTPGALEAPTGESDNTSIDALEKLSDEDIALLARTYKRHLAQFPSALSAEGARTREHVQQIQALFERMQSVPRFKPVSWGRDKGLTGEAADDFQRALWLLEHDLTRSVFLKLQFDWDSHFRNADKQSGANGSLMHLLDNFFAELESRKNAHGTLASQTLVVVGSELGRFPVVNSNLGKDHFPESSFLFYGSRIAAGRAFVPTGRRMEGLAVSAKTGLPGDAGAEHLVLDDIGTTLLHIHGLRPDTYGYRGRRLNFLERA